VSPCPETATSSRSASRTFLRVFARASLADRLRDLEHLDRDPAVVTLFELRMEAQIAHRHSLTIDRRPVDPEVRPARRPSRLGTVPNQPISTRNMRESPADLLRLRRIRKALQSGGF